MKFTRDRQIHVMPRTFGAAGGPRQAPDDADFRHTPTTFTRFVVRFLGRADQLQPLLPPGLTLRGEPVVQVQFFKLTDIPWLAGRGYNILSVLIPAQFASHDGATVDGQYQAVLWENMGDPIVTGREQLGHPKLYAQLAEPRTWNGATHLRASWEDFTFAELELTCDDEPDGNLIAEIKDSSGVGLIGHKYIPKTGSWDEADADYLTLTPLPGESNLRDPQPFPTVRAGSGTVVFNPPQWQDMPTQYHIIRQLAALEQVEPRTAFIMSGTTYADAADQRILV